MEDLRLNGLSAAESVAREYSGIDTGAEFFIPNVGSLDEAIDNRTRAKLNEGIDEVNKKISTYSDNVEEAVKELSHSVDNCQIKTLGTYVLVKPFKENPFQKIKVDNATGLIVDLGGYQPEYKRNDNGEYEAAEQMIITGVVVDVGPECKYLKEGDTIMWVKEAALPIPFYKFGFYRVNEMHALVVINDNLDKRFHG